MIRELYIVQNAEKRLLVSLSELVWELDHSGGFGIRTGSPGDRSPRAGVQNVQ